MRYIDYDYLDTEEKYRIVRSYNKPGKWIIEKYVLRENIYAEGYLWWKKIHKKVVEHWHGVSEYLGSSDDEKEFDSPEEAKEWLDRALDKRDEEELYHKTRDKTAIPYERSK